MAEKLLDSLMFNEELKQTAFITFDESITLHTIHKHRQIPQHGRSTSF
jgi:hypothetical protein